MSKRPHIALILTGGTLDMVGRDRLDMAWYVENEQRLSDEEVVARVPELHEVANVTVVPNRKLPSTEITSTDWITLARTVAGLVGEHGADGVVITHGTNTLEETAYFLHLTIGSDHPVVLTGAMRPPSAMSPDGDLNLLNAVAVAADPAARDKGVLVVFNDTIHAARDVTKGHTFRTHAFRERDLGPLGFADNDRRVVFYRAPVRLRSARVGVALDQLDRLPRVDVAVSHVGADGVMIDAAIDAGAKGIVFAGSGAGMGGPAEDEALDRAQAAGALVCVCSRTGAGRTVRRPGLASRGFVAADDLPPWKARILLALALTATQDPDRIQQLFDTY